MSLATRQAVTVHCQCHSHSEPWGREHIGCVACQLKAISSFWDGRQGRDQAPAPCRQSRQGPKGQTYTENRAVVCTTVPL